MSAPFKYKPKHWWQWWKYRKQIKCLNKIAGCWWGREGESTVTKALNNSLLYGTGYFKLYWNPDDKDQITENRT